MSIRFQGIALQVALSLAMNDNINVSGIGIVPVHWHIIDSHSRFGWQITLISIGEVRILLIIYTLQIQR